MNRLLFSLLVLLASAANECGAQELRVVGEVDHPSAAALREVVDANRYTLLTRDTVLDAGSRIQGDLVVAGSVVRVEGRIEGAIVVLPGGDLFMRPGAVATGRALAIRGGLYLSDRATVGERLTLPAEVDATLVRTNAGYVLNLTAPPPPSVVRSTGVFGVGAPTYDRVDGLTLRAGVRFRIDPDSGAATLATSLLYHTARERFGGIATLRVPVGSTTLIVEGARRTDTNDRWIRGDLANSLAAFFVRSDARNYYEADLAAVEFSRAFPFRQQVDSTYLAPRFRVAAERGRSISASDPWTVFGSAWRANPSIDPGTIISTTLGTGVRWRGLTTAFQGDVALEWAPPGVGDHQFRLVTLDGRWTMVALGTHTISVRAHALHPLGSDAPRQRWSILGGPGTLPTLETGELSGDHLAFVESTYAIPVEPIVLPFLGSPSLVGRHAIGSAWSGRTGRPPFDQSVGAGVAFPLASATVDVDPADPDHPVVSFAVTLPF